MKKLGDIYKNAFTFTFYQNRFTLIGTTVFFIALTVLGALYFNKDQAAMQELIREFSESVSDMHDEGILASVDLFINNARVALLSQLVGLIPFLFIPAILLTANAVTIGAVWSMYNVAGINPVPVFLAGIAPHGIFELPAIFISMSIGLYTCYTISHRIIGGKNRQGTVVPVLKNAALSYVLIVIPLLIVAAVVEAYVTPVLLDLVIG